jgi:hypothetical protein
MSDTFYFLWYIDQNMALSSSRKENKQLKVEPINVYAEWMVDKIETSSSTSSGCSDFFNFTEGQSDSRTMYMFHPVRLSAHYMDCKWGGKKNNTPIQLWGRNETNAQKFYIKHHVNHVTIHAYDGAVVHINNDHNAVLWENADNSDGWWIIRRCHE